MGIPAASPDRLVVGIDFGTTFSGVASSYSSDAERPDDINVIKTWPGGNGITSDKVPSELAYGPCESISRASSTSSDWRRSVQLTPADSRDGGSPSRSSSSRSGSNNIFQFVSVNAALNNALEKGLSLPVSKDQVRWGFQLRPDENRLKCMKLFLDPVQNLPSFISKTDMEEQLQRSGKKAEEAVADYLTALFKHAKETLSRRYGDYFMKTTRLELVLTVPAVWSDHAKEATINAAQKAGMGQDIRMISEPEAAAVYTLQAIQPNHLRTGDNFIVCDAGGGTVDLISYEIKQISPLRIEETVQGTGACCGSVLLNVKFEEYLRSKLGEESVRFIREKRPRCWAAAMDKFENYVKRNFDPSESVDFNIPFPGIADNQSAGIEQGFLTMSSTAVGSLFKPVIEEIIGLVEQQMSALRSLGKSAKGIVLVGGFGQSNCLYKCLQAHFADVAPPPPYPGSEKEYKDVEQKFEIMQPPNAWTAVVRGAVLRGLEGTELVLSRKSRRHYGVKHRRPYNSAIHRRSDRVWDKHLEKYDVHNQVTWYIKKGQTCSSTDPILFTFHNTWTSGDSTSESAYLVYCDDDEAPLEYDPSNTGPVRKLCKLVSNLKPVPSCFWSPRVNSKGLAYNYLDYALGMQIESGGLRFDLRVDDVVYGEVVADFK